MIYDDLLLPVILGVMIRGEITHSMYSIWQNKLKQSPFNSVIMKVEDRYHSDCNVIVIGYNSNSTANVKLKCSDEYQTSERLPSGTLKALLQWMNLKDIKDIEKMVNSNQLVIVTYHWIVDSIKAGEMIVKNIKKYSLVAPFEQIDSRCNTSEKTKVSNQSDAPSFNPKRDARYPAFACQISSTKEMIINDKAITAENKNSNLTALSTDNKKLCITARNNNKHITDVLEKLQQVYEQSSDEWRSIGYKRCCALLKKMPLITDIAQLNGKKTIGKSIYEKIKEILETGELKKLQYFEQNPKIKAITELSKIWGVGHKTAEVLYKQGYHTIELLRNNGLNHLNDQQRIGLKHYEDFLCKIPREEMTQLFEYVSVWAKRLNPRISITACGSYRRGKSESGDIDILITPSNEDDNDRLEGHFLSELVHHLTVDGFLTDHLALPNGYYEHIKTLASTDLIAHEDILVTPPTQDSAHLQERRIIDVEVEDCHRSDRVVSIVDLIDSDPEPMLGNHPIIAGRDKKRTIDNDSVDSGSPLGSRAEMEWNSPSSSQMSVNQCRYRQSYMGVCKLPDKVNEASQQLSTSSNRKLFRRIDIKTYPRSMAPFALLYFTGSDHFNRLVSILYLTDHFHRMDRSMRLFASKKGYSLNDKGLFRAARVAKRAKIACSTQSVDCKTEREIFEALDLQYKEPWDRNVFDTEKLDLNSIPRTDD